MIYKQFQDLRLSALGMGCMRLPMKGPGNADVDEAATAKMVARAMEAGVNYYDTAWAYHDGESELVMGRVLKAYPRESFYLATKFPGYDVSNMGKAKEIFQRQLEKLQVDYFDFYLFHNVNQGNIDGFLDEQYGVHRYLMEQKAAGRIRHLGFSTHGSLEVMRRFLDAYGKDMEFCQIQLNWLDWKFQDAEAKVELLREYGIPVWVMEPVRGGRLAQLPPAETARLQALRPGVGIPAWAFRFLQTIPEVTMILSGMSDQAQLEDNLATFATQQPLTREEWDALQDMAGEMIEKNAVPCTACRYCMEKCPQGINIPGMLRTYSDQFLTGTGQISVRMLASVPEDKRPTACLGCGACAAVCPQNIDIPALMHDFAGRLK